MKELHIKYHAETGKYPDLNFTLEGSCWACGEEISEEGSVMDSEYVKWLEEKLENELNKKPIEVLTIKDTPENLAILDLIL
jgi:hypothetical protein